MNGNHEPAGTVIVHDKVVDTAYFGVGEHQSLYLLYQFRVRSFAQQRSNGILYRHDARIDDEQCHGKTAITVDVKLEEMRNDACSEYYACGDAVGKRVLRCRMER